MSRPDLFATTELEKSTRSAEVSVESDNSGVSEEVGEVQEACDSRLNLAVLILVILVILSWSV